VITTAGACGDAHPPKKTTASARITSGGHI
jgi:hypothetical protein